MHVLARKVTTWMLISRVAQNRSQIVRYFTDFFENVYFDQNRDIDECFFGSECTGIAICRNVDGSYSCECPEGQLT